MRAASLKSALVSTALIGAVALLMATSPGRAVEMRALNLAPAAASDADAIDPSAVRGVAADACGAIVPMPNVMLPSGFARPKMARRVSADRLGLPDLRLLVAHPCPLDADAWNS